MKPIFKSGTLCITLLLSCGWCVAQASGFGCGNKESNQTRPVTKIDLGDVTKKARQLPRPKYPQLANTAGASGIVNAQVVIDINSGAVVWAQTISGHPLLQAAVRDVVCRARFVPMFDANGFVGGTLVYRFARRR
jgi:outer membrane biosynthesis protein TonB